MRVLIVEDDLSTRNLIEHVLNDLDVYCCTASNVDEAVRQVGREKPDIILLDLMLENRIGTELIDILNRRYLDPPKFVVMTALSNPSRYLNRYKIKRVIQKPFLLHELEESLD